jgi:hypothetical protein
LKNALKVKTRYGRSMKDFLDVKENFGIPFPRGDPDGMHMYPSKPNL